MRYVIIEDKFYEEHLDDDFSDPLDNRYKMTPKTAYPVIDVDEKQLILLNPYEKMHAYFEEFEIITVTIEENPEYFL